MNDFDAVAVFKLMLRVLRTRHDDAVDLDCDASFAKTLVRQQNCDGGSGFGLAHFAIELDLHVIILAQNACRACGGATCDR